MRLKLNLNAKLELILFFISVIALAIGSFFLLVLIAGSFFSLISLNSSSSSLSIYLRNVDTFSNLIIE